MVVKKQAPAKTASSAGSELLRRVLLKAWLGEPSDELISFFAVESRSAGIDVAQDGRIINLNKTNIAGLRLQHSLGAFIALKQLHRREVFRAE